MAIPVRGTKASAGGGTAFVSNTDILASEVNTDFDNIYAQMSNIEDTNVAAAAGIETTKIDGYSDSTTEMRDEVSPGVSGSESLPSTIRGELQRLRFKLKELVLGTATARNTTASGDDTYWYDTPMTGPNLLRNANFAVKTTAAGAAPDGWALVGTPGTCALTTTGVTEGPTNMRAIRIAAAGAVNEGISQTLAGLKASTKYVVGVRAKVNAGGDIFSLVTTGASGATFGNLTLTTSSTTYVTLAGVIVTDATPTNIVVQLLAVADGDSVDVTHCWVRECNTDRLPLSNSAWAYGEIGTVTANHYTPSNTFVDSGITGVAVVAPGPGYVIEVVGYLDFSDTSVAVRGVLAQLQENAVAVQTKVGLLTADGNEHLGGVDINYVNRSPTPGTTYTYTLFGAGSNAPVGRNHTAVGGETPMTWLRCRAVLESGT